MQNSQILSVSSCKGIHLMELCRIHAHFDRWQVIINKKIHLNPIETADIVETALVQLCNTVSMIFKNPTHQCKGSHVTASL